MKPFLGRKAYTLAPFIIAALVILGVTMAVYFSQVDSSKANAVKEEGRTVKEALVKEEEKAATYTRILFAAYQAAYDAANYKGTDQSPMASPEGLKAFLSERIKKYLGSGDALNVEIIDNDEIRDQGFIVKATGSIQGQEGTTELDIEKFVNARIFLLQKLMAENNVEVALKEEYAKRIQCAFRGTNFNEVTCSYRKNDNTIACTGTLSGESRAYPAWMSDQDQVRTNILKRLPEVERKYLKGEILRDLKDASMGVTIDLNEARNIRTSAQVTETKGNSPCCEPERVWDPITLTYKLTGRCKTGDVDYNVQIKTSGEMVFDIRLIDYAGIKEVSVGTTKSTADSSSSLIGYNPNLFGTSPQTTAIAEFEVCTSSPIMLMDGSITPLQQSKQTNVNLDIQLTYRSDCKVTPPNPKNPTTVKGPIMKYGVKEGSLKFTEEEITCVTESSFGYQACSQQPVSQSRCPCDGSWTTGGSGADRCGGVYCTYRGVIYCVGETVLYQNRLYKCLSTRKFEKSCSPFRGRYYFTGERRTDKNGAPLICENGEWRMLSK